MLSILERTSLPQKLVFNFISSPELYHMKKIILIFIGFISISVSCMAQTEKGNILLGGYAYLSTFKSTGMDGRATYFGINPTAGIFLADNLVIGTGLGYVNSSYPINIIYEEEMIIDRSKANAVSVSPFGRYYVGITPQIKFFGQLEAAVNWKNIKASDTEVKMGEKDRKSTFYSAALSPGFAIFPSKRIGIELSFNGFQFTKQRWKKEGVTTSDSRSFSFGSDFFNPRLGIQFYL